MRVESKKLRDAARGKDCTLRIPGVCNFNSDTTVLAHVPCGMKGMGMKSPDNMAVNACSSCHDVLDGRSKSHEVDGWDVVRALAETQMQWIEAGLVTVAGVKLK